MKSRSLVMALVAIAVVMSAAGCGGTDKTASSAEAPGLAPDPDGILCPDNPKGPKAVAVYIDIAYALDGTPSASPDQCYVDAGTRITWRDPPDKTTAFNVIFSSAPPTAEGAAHLSAMSAAGRYKVTITTYGSAGSYKYGLQANGKTVDPAIIIR